MEPFGNPGREWSDHHELLLMEASVFWPATVDREWMDVDLHQRPGQVGRENWFAHIGMIGNPGWGVKGASRVRAYARLKLNLYSRRFLSSFS